MIPLLFSKMPGQSFWIVSPHTSPKMGDSWSPNPRAPPYIPKKVSSFPPFQSSSSIYRYFPLGVGAPRSRVVLRGLNSRRVLARILQGVLLLGLVFTIAVNVVIIADKTQRLANLIPARVQGRELKNEKKNEKCLFSNTQEFLHNIFIKSFK